MITLVLNQFHYNSFFNISNLITSPFQLYLCTWSVYRTFFLTSSPTCKHICLPSYLKHGRYQLWLYCTCLGHSSSTRFEFHNLDRARPNTMSRSGLKRVGRVRKILASSCCSNNHFMLLRLKATNIKQSKSKTGLKHTGAQRRLFRITFWLLKTRNWSIYSGKDALKSVL